MKTFKNLVIGGIENKVVNLILITIIVISAAFMGMTLYQNKMLEDVNAETIGKQQQALTDITNGIMNDIVDQSMDQTTELKAQMADEVFHNLAVRVGMMGEYAGKLFQDPSVEDGSACGVDNGVLAVIVLLEVLGVVVEDVEDSFCFGNFAAVGVHDHVGGLNAVRHVLVVVVEGAFLGVHFFAVGGVDDRLIAEVYQNIVAHLREIAVGTLRVFQAVHKLFGLEVEDLEVSFVENITVLRHNGKLAVCGKEERLVLVLGLLSSGENKDVAGTFCGGVASREFDDRRVERDQDFAAFSVDKAGAVDFAVDLNGDTVEAPSEVFIGESFS